MVQTAANLVLEPIFEADFEDSAYGYRPVRGAVDAVREVHRLNSKLPDGLDLGEIVWPRLRATARDPQQFIEADQRLKFEMDRQKLHEQELMFFGCEMQSREAALGRKTLNGLAIAIYGASSDYGRSYIRPLGVLLAPKRWRLACWLVSGCEWKEGT